MKYLKWAGITITLLFLTGCLALPRISLGSKPGSETTKFKKVQKEEIPRVFYDEKGRPTIAIEKRWTKETGAQRSMAKLTFAQRIANKLAGLGTVAMIVLIAGLILAPGATMAWLAKTGLKWRRAFRETVTAIKESKAVSDGNGLHDALKDQQTATTKKLVGITKASL